MARQPKGGLLFCQHKPEINPEAYGLIEDGIENRWLGWADLLVAVRTVGEFKAEHAQGIVVEVDFVFIDAPDRLVGRRDQAHREVQHPVGQAVGADHHRLGMLGGGHLRQVAGEHEFTLVQLHQEIASQFQLFDCVDPFDEAGGDVVLEAATETGGIIEPVVVDQGGH